MRCLRVGVIILLSKFVFSQLTNRAPKRIPVAPKCDPDTPILACCPIQDEFPRGCIPFNPNDPRCSDRRMWWCCFKLEPGYTFPGGELYPNHGINCRRAIKYVWGDRKEFCPVPAPAIPNPFQPIEDFMRLKAGDKRSTSGQFDCQSPSPESLLPSPAFSELSRTTLDAYSDDTGLLFLNDQDEQQNNIATSNDIDDSTPMFSPQNEIGTDDLISTNFDYNDDFLIPNEAGVGGSVNDGQSTTTSGEDIALFTDQDIFNENARV